MLQIYPLSLHRLNLDMGIQRQVQDSFKVFGFFLIISSLFYGEKMKNSKLKCKLYTLYPKFYVFFLIQRIKTVKKSVLAKIPNFLPLRWKMMFERRWMNFQENIQYFPRGFSPQSFYWYSFSWFVFLSFFAYIFL